MTEHPTPEWVLVCVSATQEVPTPGSQSPQKPRLSGKTDTLGLSHRPLTAAGGQVEKSV